MDTHTFLISVSIDEFTALHASGILRVDGNRLVPGGARSASPLVITSLLSKMPEFLDRDEHAVLVLAFDLSDVSGIRRFPTPSTPDFRFVLVAEDCREIIPLTAHAKSILQGRLGSQTVLSEPVFEAEMIVLFKDRIRMRSLRGGDALVGCLVDAAGHSISEGLAERALLPGASGFEAIARALDFTRTKPLVREPISGLRDLGGILLEGLPGKTPDSLLLELSSWLRPKQETLGGFQKVYRDAALIDILGRLTEIHKLPAHAASLGIFLHWRELALKAGGLDLGELEKDCRELAGCVTGTVLIDALWLLGFNAGFETFSTAYYERLEGPHPFAAKRKTRQPVTLLWPASSPTVAEELKEIAAPIEKPCESDAPSLAEPARESIEKNSDQATDETEVSSETSPKSGETNVVETPPDTAPLVSSPPLENRSEPEPTPIPTHQNPPEEAPKTETGSKAEATTRKPAVGRKNAAAPKKPGAAKKGEDTGWEQTLL